MLINSNNAHKFAVNQLTAGATAASLDINNEEAVGSTMPPSTLSLPKIGLSKPRPNPDQQNQSEQRFNGLHNNALVMMQSLSAEAGVSQVRVPIPLQKAQAHFEQQFHRLAQNETQFHQILQTVFGVGINRDKAEQLRERVALADFSWLPQVKLSDSRSLNGASGAYAADTNTVYLSDGLISADAPISATFVRSVLIEEYGHSIDYLLNTNDAVGDEGALFALMLSGATLTTTELEHIQAEDDNGVVEIDGEVLHVEYSMLSKEARRFASRVGDFFSDLGTKLNGLLQRLLNIPVAATELFKDVVQIIETVIKRPYEMTLEVVDGIVSMVELIGEGKIAKAGTVFRDSLINSGKLGVGLVVEVVTLSVNASVMAFDRLRGAITERALNTAEKNYLKPIFGTGLDYSDINIVSGGVKDQWGMAAHVIGNEIFMPKQLADGSPTFNANGTLTTGGLALLSHEAAHVWQFQHGGTSYISVSLAHQIYDGEKDTYNWHHAVLQGTAFSDMNPERQAEIARLIGQAIAFEVAAGRPAKLTFAALTTVIDSPHRPVSADQFRLFETAHAVLNPQISLLNSGLIDAIGRQVRNHLVEPTEHW